MNEEINANEYITYLSRHPKIQVQRDNLITYTVMESQLRITHSYIDGDVVKC